MTTRWFETVVVACLFALVLAGCSSQGGSAGSAPAQACSGASPPPGVPVVEIAVDPTLSAATDATVADVAVVVDKVIEDKGFLLVRRVGASVSGADLVCSGRLAPRGPNDVLRRRSAAAIRREVLDRVREAMTSARPDQTRGTDLFAAMGAAADDMARFPDRDRRLVVRSDFLHNAAPFNLSAVQLDQANTDRLIGELQRRQLIPSLAGVRVYMSGLGDTAAGDVSAETAAGLSMFWRSYFAAAGAEVAGSGSRLVAFP